MSPEEKAERLSARIENCELSRLKEQAKIVNEIGGADKIKLVAIKKIDLANAFTIAVEKTAGSKGEDSIPDTVSALYNDLHMDDESPLDKTPKAPPKKEKKAASGGTKKSGPPQQPVNEYGVRPNTLANKFVQTCLKDPQTMEDIRKADWNPRGYHFNDTLDRLVKENIASVDKDGIITINPVK